jgi:hypothetical protein
MALGYTDTLAVRTLQRPRRARAEPLRMLAGPGKRASVPQRPDSESGQQLPSTRWRWDILIRLQFARCSARGGRAPNLADTRGAG